MAAYVQINLPRMEDTRWVMDILAGAAAGDLACEACRMRRFADAGRDYYSSFIVGHRYTRRCSTFKGSIAPDAAGLTL